MRCINTTGCLTAYRHEEIHPKPGTPSVCPECGTPLSASPLHKGMPVRMVAAVVLAAALGAAAYFGRPYVVEMLKNRTRNIAAPTVAPASTPAPSIVRANPTPASTPIPRTPPPVVAVKRPDPTPERAVATTAALAPTPTPKPTVAPREIAAAVTEPPKREPEQITDASAYDSNASPRVRGTDRSPMRSSDGLKGLSIVHLPPLGTPVPIIGGAPPQDAPPRRRARDDSSAPPPDAAPRVRVKIDWDHTPIRLDSPARPSN